MPQHATARSGLFWSAISSWTNTLLSFAIVVILARLLTPQDFGLIGIATVAIAVGSIVISDTVSAALVQRLTLEDAHLHSAFWGTLLLGVIISGVAIALAPIISDFFEDQRLTPVLQLLSLRMILDASCAVPFGLLFKRRDFKSLALRALLANVGGGFVGVVLAIAGAGVWALVAQQLAIGVINVAVCLPRTGWRPRFVFSPIHALDLIPFSTYTMLTRAIAFLDTYAVRIIIGDMMGVASVAYIVFARRVQEMSVGALTGVVTNVTFPLFSDKQDNFAELRQALFRTASLTSIVAFPAFLGLAATAPDLIPLIFSAKWSPAIPIVQLFACNSIMSTIGGIHESLLRAMNRVNWWLMFSLIPTSLVLVGWIFAASYSLTAVALCSVIVSFLFTPVTFWMVKRLVPFRLGEYLVLYAPPFAGAVGMALILLLLRHLPEFNALPLNARVSLEITIGCVSYATLLLVLARDQAMGFIRYILPFRTPV